MDFVLISLTVIILLFVVFLVAKQVAGREFCVLCASVSMTWAALLAARMFGEAVSGAVIGVLVGTSVTGIWYAVSRNVPERLLVFRLPFFLTLLLFAYWAAGEEVGLGAAGIVVGTWIVLYAAYAYRAHPQIRTAVRKIIECCKQW